MELISNQSFDNIFVKNVEKEIIMKKYLIKVKEINETEIIVEANNKEAAIYKVAKLMNIFYDNVCDNPKVFPNRPVLLYRAFNLKDD